MSTVDIKINGRPLTVDAGTSILSAAKLAGCKIPTLCYHSDLDPSGACGICVVKIEGNPRMVRSCCTKVS